MLLFGNISTSSRIERATICGALVLYGANAAKKEDVKAMEELSKQRAIIEEQIKAAKQEQAENAKTLDKLEAAKRELIKQEIKAGRRSVFVATVANMLWGVIDKKYDEVLEILRNAEYNDFINRVKAISRQQTEEEAQQVQILNFFMELVQ